MGHPQRLFSKDEPQFNPSSNFNWNHLNMYASSHLRTRPASSIREAVSLPGSAFADLPLLSHQRHSSASSRIWALQFPPRSLGIFSHRLF